MKWAFGNGSRASVWLRDASRDRDDRLWRGYRDPDGQYLFEETQSDQRQRFLPPSWQTRCEAGAQVGLSGRRPAVDLL
jgi:hypothetical protein